MADPKAARAGAAIAAAAREALPHITAEVEVGATAPRGQMVRAMGVPEETEPAIQYRDQLLPMAEAEAEDRVPAVAREETAEPEAAGAAVTAATITEASEAMELRTLVVAVVAAGAV